MELNSILFIKKRVKKYSITKRKIISLMEYSTYYPSVIAHASNPRTWEAKAGGSRLRT